MSASEPKARQAFSTGYAVQAPTFNQEPRPRVLFEEVSDDVFEELSLLVPTFRRISETESVHESEYDLVVTQSRDTFTRAAHLNIVSFGAQTLDETPNTGTTRYNVFNSHPRRNMSTMANEASIPDTIDASLSRLLERTVVATIPSGEKFLWHIPEHALDRVQVLVELGPEKLPYALLWKRRAGEETAQTLVLPTETTGKREWFLWMLKELSNLHPDSFPGEEEWATSPAWATAGTTELHKNSARSQERYGELLSEAEAQVSADRDALDEAQKEDSKGLHKLLTADGPDLEAAVVEALSILGFAAHPMDDHHDAVTNAKLEDLRVTDPDDDEWICLAEIKGYTKGAKTNDINQITGRPLIAYLRENGQEPSALWHIVNIRRGTSPGTRGPAVANDLDLAHLAGVRGILIDSRQLFLAVRDVQLGQRDADEVRAGLRGSFMRWDYRVDAVSLRVRVG